MVLKKMFEEVVDPAFHSGSIGIAIKGFGTTPPVDILANLQQIYGKTSYQELDAALIRLKEPMNRMQPVEVMLRGIKEVRLLNTMKCNKTGHMDYTVESHYIGTMETQYINSMLLFQCQAM